MRGKYAWLTMLHVEQGVATVQDVEALLEAEKERAIQAYEEARRVMYRARAQRSGGA